MMNQSSASEWRKLLKQKQEALRLAFTKSLGTQKLLKQHSKFVDQLLIDLWEESTIQNQACLIAVGGYGRSELFPYSDVDLLILISSENDQELNRKIEVMVSLFWDIGLAVGHSVRSLKECLEEAKKDVTVLTNLIESRFLVGNQQLFSQFNTEINSAMNVSHFFTAKLAEQELRHKRYGDTANNLEPNIKESPGGLRDLQNILWITRALGIGGQWQGLVKHHLISELELKQIKKHELHLQMLRTRLHYLAKRREDRLIFDLQNELASELGYHNSKNHRASEQLMHGYYKTAKFVSLINEVLIKLLKDIIFPPQGNAIKINARFESQQGLIHAKQPQLLQQNPKSILEIFLLLEQHPELTGISPSLLRDLNRVKKLVNKDFRVNPENKMLFMDIIKQGNGVRDTLRLMNRYEILGSYIPAFGRIVGQMQHDLFHVFTVDEHILNVVGNLYRFSRKEYAHEFPLCSALIEKFESPYLLYLAALFHDIAKGRGGDHSELGTVDAERFCKQHNLSKEDTHLVSWLVASHLIMSSTAQKSDLSDSHVIENFAALMQNERRLTALYLLTVADIRGTSPKVWNAWKAKLLETLFLKTKSLLDGKSNNADEDLLIKQNEAISILSHYGILEKFYIPFWEKLGKQYFIRHTSQEIAWHSRLLLRHINTTESIVRARLSPMGDGIQVMIYTHDRDDLFACICNFFDRMGYGIVEAKIHTSQHGYALDSFLILDNSEKSISYRDLLSYIEYELGKKLNDNIPPEKPIRGRLSRQVKHMPIKTHVLLKKIDNSNNHQLDFIGGDQPGLLSTIAHTFLLHQVHIQTAKINTLGSRAEDSFLISAKNGMELENDNIKALEAALINNLTL
jgi:[protein-PII] uridylyltransferase